MDNYEIMQEIQALSEQRAAAIMRNDEQEAARLEKEIERLTEKLGG